MHQPSGFGIFTVQDPAPLPGPPLLSGWVFESPLAPAIIVLVGGALAFAVLRARNPTAARASLVAAVVLPVVLFVSASMVTTDRERIIERAADLVAATATADAPRLGALLAEGCTLIEPGSRSELERGELLGAVSSRIPSFEIREHAVKETQAVVDNDRFARVQIKVFVSSKLGGPNNSWWHLDYEKDASGAWKVTRIKPLAISGMNSV